MRKELIDELRQRHPQLLGPMGEPAIQPSILCGDGWFNLIDCLCEILVSAEEHHVEAVIRVDEIKSKYGSLRFETSGLQPEGEAQVALIELISERTCEVCGGPGVTINRSGWLATLCETHAATEHLTMSSE